MAYSYQEEAIGFLADRSEAMLWLGMGLGKTMITLTHIVEKNLNPSIIFGPLRVVQSVWTREASKWEHTKHLTFSVVTGTKKERLKALYRDADVYLCNYENMAWLAEVMKKEALTFKLAVYDEITRLKDSNCKKMAGGTRYVYDKKTQESTKEKVVGWLNVRAQCEQHIGLTGTPTPNGFIDLHGQYLAVDGGQRLGRYKTHFRDTYFKSDYMGWSYQIDEENQGLIEKAIAPITLKMDTRDYLDLPPVREVELTVHLPDKARKAYRELEKELFTALDSGEEIELSSKAALTNKCLQLSNGTPYVEAGQPESVALHDAKMDALESVLQEAAGSPVVCSYLFRSDAVRIMKKFKSYKPVNLTETKSSQTQKVIDDFKAGKHKLLIGHPASMGHGVDGLQDVCNTLVWFGLPWSSELYDQMNKRIDRQGQKKNVTIVSIMAEDTLDHAVRAALQRKEGTQEAIKQAIGRYRYRNIQF